MPNLTGIRNGVLLGIVLWAGLAQLLVRMLSSSTHLTSLGIG